MTGTIPAIHHFIQIYSNWPATYVYRLFNHYDKLVANATVLYFIYFLIHRDKQKMAGIIPAIPLTIYLN